MSYCGIFLTVEELHDKFGDITMVVGSLDELMPAAIAKAEELCWWEHLVLRYLKACMNEQENFQMQLADGGAEGRAAKGPPPGDDLHII